MNIVPFHLDHNYEVYEDGRVWSIPRECGGRRKTCGGRFLSKSIDNKGYTQVSVNGKKYLLHKILAIAFISNPDNKTEVIHLNGILSDNRVCNLQWATRREVAAHQRLIGNTYNIGECNASAKLNEEQVLTIRSSNRQLHDLANEYGLHRTTIVRAQEGNTWKHLSK